MIVLQNVSKSYRKGLPVLRNITLSISRDEFVFVTGPNGAGKSTLLKMLTLQERPTDGVIVIDGLNTALIANGALPAYRRKIGMVFQDTKLFSNRTVFENVALPLRISSASGRIVRELTNAGLHTVGLDEFSSRRVNELSGGELRRVAIARAIVGRPQILLADEPTGNLDEKNARDVLDLIIELNDNQNTALLIVTHDLSIANKMARKFDLTNGCLNEK